MEIKLGQHFQFEPLPRMKTGENGFIGYSFEKKVAVEFVKSTERFLLQSIIQRAQDNGITDLYVLNEDFVMDAIREKLEQEGRKMPYIDKQAAVDAVKEVIENLDQQCKSMMDFYSAIWNVPDADVAPVVQGHWMQTPHCFMGMNCFECSNCYSDPFWNEHRITEKYPRCPNCGAKMDGDII